jgi:hypothetical protein
MQSKQFTLNKEDGLKILKGAGMAVGGSLVAYLLLTLNDVDFGTYGYILIPLCSIVLNSLDKFFKGN